MMMFLILKSWLSSGVRTTTLIKLVVRQQFWLFRTSGQALFRTLSVLPYHIIEDNILAQSR